MKKTKRIFSFVMILCLAICTSIVFAACTKKGDYPNYRNPNTTSSEYDGKYVISVVSAGGLNLDGVRVSAMKNGTAQLSGISHNGVIELSLPADEYILKVDESTLPEGYYVPEDADFRTTPNLASAKISLPSRIITTTADSGKRYALGDVMHDFGFVETNGTRYTLSEILSRKKAVMLNFWYTTCVPCQQEFPAIQKAYEAYGDKIEIIALSAQDGMSKIRSFKETFNLTFYMGPDQAGITSLFNISGFPTTIIVDRYGVVAYRDSGSVSLESTWMALFNRYTADNYTQEVNPDDAPDTPVERVKPDASLSMPTSAVMAAAVNGNGAEDKVDNYRPETSEPDAEYSWPWLIGNDEEGAYAYASNAGTNYTFAILYVDLHLQTGDVVSYWYNVNTETDKDLLYVQVDGAVVARHSGNSEGWKREYGIYVANYPATVTLSFCYIKDQLETVEGDAAKIKAITISDITDADGALDQQVSAVDSIPLSDGKYDVQLIAPGSADNDSIYYKYVYTDADGKEAQSILFADINNATYWAEKRMGPTFIAEGSRRASALYQISFWQMSNYADENKTELRFTYGDAAMSEAVIENYYLQEFSDNGLLPVTEGLRNILETFSRKFCKDNDKYEYYEDQWLEFCYFFKHFGERHINGSVCNREANPVEGLSRTHAIQIMGKDHINQRVNITKIINLNGGGLWYSFIPGTTGVYYFYSERDSKDIATDPNLTIYDDTGEWIVHAENDVRRDHFLNRNRENFYTYAVLEANREYHIQAAMYVPGSTGAYTLHIDYEGSYKEELRICSTGDGSWSSMTSYNAIPVAYNNTDGYYHAVTENNEYGSVVYIDFIHPNFFDAKDNTLYDLIMVGRFNLNGTDYTQDILRYYYKAIERDRDDELYGMVEATQELVNMLNALTATLDGDGPRAFAWLMFGCYYEYYGTPTI